MLNITNNNIDEIKIKPWWMTGLYKSDLSQLLLGEILIEINLADIIEIFLKILNKKRASRIIEARGED